jgi:hypothetical protein
MKRFALDVALHSPYSLRLPSILSFYGALRYE